MRDLFASLVLAVVVFLSTDMDNMLILTVFFADPKMQPGSVIVGQYVGIGVLVLLSVFSALLAISIPTIWISLLGIVPLFLGVRGLVTVIFSRNIPSLETVTKQEQRLQTRTHSQVIAVALVAMAHGADNLGVYIPFFAKSPARIPLNVTVFAVMIAISCLVGHMLVKNRLLGRKISHYGRFVIPFVLLGLGLHILWGARSLFSH